MDELPVPGDSGWEIMLGLFWGSMYEAAVAAAAAAAAAADVAVVRPLGTVIVLAEKSS